MIMAVGFNGERSVWCANLFAIVAAVRALRPGKWSALALSPAIYESVYLGEGFCAESNRLQVSGAFYSEPQSNMIVMPIRDKTPDDVRFTAKVSYRYPQGPWGKVLRAYYCQGRPQIGSAVEPRRQKTAHGDYLLIGRDTCPDKYRSAFPGDLL